MNYNDKYELKSLLKDLTYDVSAIRNSKSAGKYLPDIVAKARELELMLKGAVAEINDVEEEDTE